jgi:hypothetical protein
VRAESGGVAAWRRQQQGGVVFKVMTWNVENLFSVGHASGPSTAVAYEQKIGGLAKAITDQAPDALALQEVAILPLWTTW